MRFHVCIEIMRNGILHRTRLPGEIAEMEAPAHEEEAAADDR
jgi:hypothetical protein